MVAKIIWAWVFATPKYQAERPSKLAFHRAKTLLNSRSALENLRIEAFFRWMKAAVARRLFIELSKKGEPE